jgi:hypothetical protein
VRPLKSVQVVCPTFSHCPHTQRSNWFMDIFSRFWWRECRRLFATQILSCTHFQTSFSYFFLCCLHSWKNIVNFLCFDIFVFENNFQFFNKFWKVKKKSKNANNESKIFPSVRLTYICRLCFLSERRRAFFLLAFYVNSNSSCLPFVARVREREKDCRRGFRKFNCDCLA